MHAANLVCWLLRWTVRLRLRTGLTPCGCRDLQWIVWNLRWSKRVERCISPNGYYLCHARNTGGLGGRVPDLRVNVPASVEYLQAVLDVALKFTGMPAFEVDDQSAKD